MPTVIAVFNGKGGVGKTETAKDLATRDAQAGLRVLVVGLDSDCCMTDAILGAEVSANDLTIYDVLIHPTLGMARAIKHYTRVALSGCLDIVPESMELDKAHAEFKKSSDRPNGVAFPANLHWLLRQPDIQKYQRVYLDLGPNWDETNAMALIAANKLIIPVVPEPLAIRALKRLITRIDQNNLDRVSAGITEQTQILGVVLTRVGSAAHETLARKLILSLERAQIACFKTLIPNTDAVWQSTGECLPVWQSAPQDAASLAYAQLYQEVRMALHD